MAESFIIVGILLLIAKISGRSADKKYDRRKYHKSDRHEQFNVGVLLPILIVIFLIIAAYWLCNLEEFVNTIGYK